MHPWPPCTVPTVTKNSITAWYCPSLQLLPHTNREHRQHRTQEAMQHVATEQTDHPVCTQNYNTSQPNMLCGTRNTKACTIQLNTKHKICLAALLQYSVPFATCLGPNLLNKNLLNAPRTQGESVKHRKPVRKSMTPIFCFPSSPLQQGKQWCEGHIIVQCHFL